MKIAPKNSVQEEWGKRAVFSIVILLIIYALYLYNRNANNKNEIENNLATTEGYVYKVERGMRASNNIYWRFEVKGITYYNMATSIGFKNYCKRKGGCEGKKFVIEYSTINPEKSQIVIENKEYLGQKGSKTPL